jgi:hypothetical protein
MARAIRFLSVVGLWAAIVPAAWAQGFCPANPSLGPSVGQWQRWEQTLTSTQDYVGADKRGNPYKDLQLRVTFKSCDSGATFQSYGFWYGVEKSPATGALVDSPRSFRIRGSFPAGGQTGIWQWHTTCSGKTTALTSANQPVQDCQNDSGLNDQTGYFKVTSGGTNALYRGGLLSLSEDRRYLTYAKTYNTVNPQGQQITQRIPFFWLGDTVWNSPIRTTYNDWVSYINERKNDGANRSNTGFTVVQIAVAPQLAGPTDTNNNPPFGTPPDPACTDSNPAPNKCSSWNPRFWAGLDDKIQYANQQGLLVFLAGLMEPLQKDFSELSAPAVVDDPGLVTFARNVAARYFGDFMVFSPGFDHMIGANLTVIREVGQTLHNYTRNLVTNHPAGSSTPADLAILQNDSWLDFQMYQSGTPGNTQTAELQNMTDRASSLATGLQSVAAPKLKSAINGEATYDGAGQYANNHTPYRVRQTAYLSFLGGAMGYTAGTCGIFDWGKGLAGCPANLDWNVQKDRLTSRSMRYLRYILQTVNWQRLRPDSNRILTQATTADKKMKIASDGSTAVVAYLPAEPAAIQIDFKAGGSSSTSYQAISGLSNLASKQAFLQSGWIYRWFSPRTGNQRNPVTSDLIYLSPGRFQFNKPSTCDNDPGDNCSSADNDWVLRITKASGPQPPPPALAAASHLEVSNEIGSVSGAPAIAAQRIDYNTGLASSYLEMGGQGTNVLGSPQVAFGPSGNTMVIWQSDNDDGTTVMGRVLDLSGNPVTAEFAINSETTMAPEHPAVTALQSGNFVVTWKGLDSFGEGPWIWYRRFDSGGSPLGPELLAMNCELISGDFPQVTASGFGGFYIAWEMASGTGIHYVEFDADANPTGQEGTLAEGSAGWPVLAAIDGSGEDLTVSWNVYGSDSTDMTSNVSGTTVQVAPGAPIVCR